MKKNLTRLFLMLIIVSVLMASCGGNGNETTTTQGGASEGTTTTTEAVTTTEDPYDENGYLKDCIPDSINYGGKDFHIFIWRDQATWDFREGDENGDVINDSILRRQLNAEERLNIKIVTATQPGSWNDRNTFIQTVENATNAGSKDFDLVAQYTPCASIGVMKNLYVDMMELENLSLDKPWWPADITESSTVYGKLYFTTGDITPTLIRNVGTILCNMDLVKSLNLDDPYELVESGKWTMEALKKMTLGTANSLNADGSPSYGFTFNNNVMFDDLFYAAGFRYVDTLEDGSIKLSDCLTSEKLIGWFDTCHSFLWDNTDVAVMSINSAFTAGNALMHLGTIADVQNHLRATDMDFAVLPVPKYDEAQESYHTLATYWCTLYSIPSIANDVGCSATVLEVLGSEGYRTLTPAIYEDAFQLRYLATEKNAVMFDLIQDSVVFDTGRNFCDAINIFATFRKAADENTLGWATIYKGQQIAWKNAIAKVLAALG